MSNRDALHLFLRVVRFYRCCRAVLPWMPAVRRLSHVLSQIFDGGFGQTFLVLTQHLVDCCFRLADTAITCSCLHFLPSAMLEALASVHVIGSSG